MTNKTFRVFNKFDYNESGAIVHDYDIVQSENNDGHDVYTLYRSFNPMWSENVRGETILTITNTGNEYLISKFPTKDGKTKLEYDIASELFILLNFINSQDPLYTGYMEEVVKTNHIKL